MSEPGSGTLALRVGARDGRVGEVACPMSELAGGSWASRVGVCCGRMGEVAR
ncbi:hypothetical protein SAMN05216174_11953 [Actinokineospora iranica]|uniref:Uncharacterized protein n=1 Tax=Actinokineospora iranica TaxID=1271860 RepID=A0A1G6XXI1_9PSEU|nr:hypothetical protein SAMN05216174_11953 [Actinokineospora iranica]